MKKRTFLILAFTIAPLSISRSADEKPEVKLELRLVVDQSNDETKTFLLKARSDAAKDEIIVTAKGLEFTPAEIRFASVVKTETTTTDPPGAVSRGINSNIAISMTRAAGERIKSWTGEHLGKKIAMVVDGKLLMAPTIQAPFGSDFSISGKFSEEEMSAIVKKLRKVPAK